MPLRVVYANDYGSINHCGSKLLNRELKRAIGRIATLAASIRHDALDTPEARRAVARNDVLVINGEGNFRGGNPRKLRQILEADGQAEAIKRVADAEQYQLLTVAEGEGQAIERVYQAIHTGDPTPDLIAIRYLQTLESVANGQATKIFLPLDTSGVLGSVAAIGEMFKEGWERSPEQPPQ